MRVDLDAELERARVRIFRDAVSCYLRLRRGGVGTTARTLGVQKLSAPCSLDKERCLEQPGQPTFPRRPLCPRLSPRGFAPPSGAWRSSRTAGQRKRPSYPWGRGHRPARARSQKCGLRA